MLIYNVCNDNEAQFTSMWLYIVLIYDRLNMLLWCKEWYRIIILFEKES